MDFGRLYDGELAYLSWVIEELFLSLERQGLTKNTLVIITSDHGENLGDHDHFTHVFSLYNTTQWVPLIVLDPDEKEPGKRIDACIRFRICFPRFSMRREMDSSKIPHQGIDLFDPAFEAGRDAVYGEYYFRFRCWM
jgi:glucan phosphoethanolaminetransferase (alkaline phosphatase superfamily)